MSSLYTAGLNAHKQCIELAPSARLVFLQMLGYLLTTAGHNVSTPSNSQTNIVEVITYPSTSSPSEEYWSVNGSATKTKSANQASSSLSKTPSNETDSCCYIYPRGVGVNTWYSSTVDVTVATVITTWLKYNNTIVPANSTTKTIVGATSIYGLYEMPDYTAIPVSATETSTRTSCSGWDTTGSRTCTDWRTLTSTYSAYSTSFSYFNPLAGVPDTLLPQDAWMYGETSIDPTGAVTFPSQTLTVHAPTPYFLFNEGIEVFTSTACPVTRTYKEYSTEIWTTKDGDWTYVTTTIPTLTRTAFEGDAADAPINSAIPGNLFINGSIAKPFPEGDYSDFDFHDWAMANSQEGSEDFLDSYRFSLPADLPQFLEAIPSVKSQHSDIGKCTPYVGDGEPTVHVAVNQLTDTAHVTSTMAGALQPISTPAGDKDADTTAGPILPPTNSDTSMSSESATRSLRKPVVIPTQDQLDTPAPSPQSSTSSIGIGDIIASVIGMIPTNAIQQSSQQNQPPADRPGASDNEQPQPPVITGGSSRVTTDPASDFVVGSQTLEQGGGAFAQGSNTISIAPQGTVLVENDNPQPIGQAQTQTQQRAGIPAAQITLGSRILTADSSSRFVVDAQTLVPGGSGITLGGTVISLASSATALVIDGHATPVAVPIGASIIVDNTPMTPIAGGGYVLPEGQTVSPGGSTVTIDGTAYSLPVQGSVIVVDGVTLPLEDNVVAPMPSTSVTQVLLPGVTLLPGSDAVISDTTYSLPLSGHEIYINGKATRMPPASETTTMTLPNGVVATQSVVPEIVIASQRLMPGGSAVTVSGTTYSATGSSILIIADGATRTKAVEGFKEASTPQTESTESPVATTTADGSLPNETGAAEGPTAGNGVNTRSACTWTLLVCFSAAIVGVL